MWFGGTVTAPAPTGMIKPDHHTAVEVHACTVAVVAYSADAVTNENFRDAYCCTKATDTEYEHSVPVVLRYRVVHVCK